MITASPPAALASFTTASSSSSSSSSSAPHIALAPVDGSDGKLGVAAVQGDGVWTYNLRTLRPVSSFTVSPSTRFSSPPLSYIVPAPASDPATVKGKGKGKAREEGTLSEDKLEDGEEEAEDEAEGAERERASSIDSSESSEPDSRSRGPSRRTAVTVSTGKSSEVWIWDGEEGGEKHVVKIPGPTQSLHRLPGLNAIVVVHVGAISIITHPSKLLSLPTTIPDDYTPLSARLIPGDDASASGLLLVDTAGVLLSLRILHPVDAAPSAQLISRTPLDLPKSINRAEIRIDGTLIASDNSHTLHTYDTRTASRTSAQLLPSGASTPLVALPAAKPLALHYAAKPSPTLLVSLLASSPAVLCAVDLAAIAPEGNITHMAPLAQLSETRHVIGVVVWHPSEGKGGRSALHTLEITTPPSGLGMAALLGSAERTARYFSLPAGSAKSAVAASAPSSQTTLDELLDKSTRTSSDWERIISALEKGTALPSATLVKALKAAVAESSEDAGADSNTNTHLYDVYTSILALPPPDISFRVALRRTLSIDDASALLHQLVAWLEDRGADDADITLGSGPIEGAAPPASSGAAMPAHPISSLLPHLSALLDAHLPQLIPHPPAGPILERLSTALAPLLATQDALRQLRAPIDALLTLAKREEQRRAVARAKRAALLSRIIGGAASSANANANAAAGPGGMSKLRKTQIEQQRVHRGVRKDGAKIGEEEWLGLGEGVGKWTVEEFQF